MSITVYEGPHTAFCVGDVCQVRSPKAGIHPSQASSAKAIHDPVLLTGTMHPHEYTGVLLSVYNWTGQDGEKDTPSGMGTMCSQSIATITL